jgi:uncharacterized membrane protein
MIWLTTYRTHISIAILVILYAVGLVGLGTANRAWFLAATPLTLLISASLLVWNHRDWNLAAGCMMAACMVLGFLVEVLGVKTGVIFGNYAYGLTLGMKLWDVPVVIALNWLLLVYATGTLAARLRVPKLAQAALAALAMTVLDVLIEPVAMRLDFWQWQGDTVPLLNYIGWLGVSFILQSLFQFLPFQKGNSIAGVVLGLQFVFFGILNFMH